MTTIQHDTTNYLSFQASQQLLQEGKRIRCHVGNKSVEITPSTSLDEIGWALKLRGKLTEQNLMECVYTEIKEHHIHMKEIPFELLRARIKCFEVLPQTMDCRVGDAIVIYELNSKGILTGRTIEREISYISSELVVQGFIIVNLV